MRTSTICLMLVCALQTGAQAKTKAKDPPRPTLDDYIREADARAAAVSGSSEGSLYRSNGLLANVSRDPRATQLDDVVTILVSDRASAVSKGDVKSTRASSAKYNIAALGGLTRVPGPWSDLANLSGQRDMQGQGSTSRENNLTTILSARITHVMPNGLMVIEGVKSVTVNSEVQTVHVRGLVRREDINSANAIRSERIAELEIQINGRGVVADSVKRPFILYRILLGLLPF